jgi:hypothetical protein
VKQQVVAVQDGVAAGAPHPAAAHGEQRRPAAGDDVEALMRAAAAARRPELADGPPPPVRPRDREDVAEELGAARARGGGRRQCKQSEKKSRTPQWCSMTRSTRPYSLASSELMK